MSVNGFAINLNNPKRRSILPARDLLPGDEVYLSGVRRIVASGRPYRLCTVLVAEDGGRLPVAHNVRLTIWNRP